MILMELNALSQFKLFKEFSLRAKSRYASLALFYSGENSEVADEIRIFCSSNAILFFDNNFPAEKPHALIEQNKIKKTIYKRLSLIDRLKFFLKSKKQKDFLEEECKKIAIFRQIFDQKRHVAEAILKQHQSKLVILPEDGISGNIYLTEAASNLKIPVVVMPYEASGKEDLFNAMDEKIQSNSAILLNPRENFLDYILSKYYQKWIYQKPEGSFLLLPTSYIIALEQTGLTLHDPWTTHGGRALQLWVESDKMQEHYLAEGIEAGKLKLTGSIYADVVYDALVADKAHWNAYRTKSKIIKNKTRILISLPPSYHDSKGAENEFPSYLEMVKTLIQELQDDNTELTISIHPATTAETRDQIIKTGIAVEDAWVLKLIPAHDIFLSFYTSAIRWAFACHKPVINYDAYNHDLHIYDAAIGFFNYRTLSKLKEQVSYLKDDLNFEGISKSMALSTMSWGAMDGKNCISIFNAIEGLW